MNKKDKKSTIEHLKVLHKIATSERDYWADKWYATRSSDGIRGNWGDGTYYSKAEKAAQVAIDIENILDGNKPAEPVAPQRMSADEYWDSVY